MIIVEVDGRMKVMKNNDEVLRMAREHPEARFHRLHYRKDTREFEDEVLTSRRIIEEYEATGIDWTMTGVRGIDYDNEEVKENGS